MEWGGPRIEARGLCHLVCKVEITATWNPTSLPRLFWRGDEARPAGLLWSGLGLGAERRTPKDPGGAILAEASPHLQEPPLRSPFLISPLSSEDERGNTSAEGSAQSTPGRGGDPGVLEGSKCQRTSRHLNWGHTSLHVSLLIPEGLLWFHCWPRTGAQACCRWGSSYITSKPHSSPPGQTLVAVLYRQGAWGS